VERLLGEFGERYPRPYTVLVTERNARMARVLQGYHEEHPERKVLVVVGAGHARGLGVLLNGRSNA